MKRRIQGIFVGHHDRTRATSYITKSGIVRGKSRTKQTLSDAREDEVGKLVLRPLAHGD